MMKTVTVKTGNKECIVKLNNAYENDALTPEMARCARNIAFGCHAYVTVSDSTSAYRVTKTVRKLRHQVEPNQYPRDEFGRDLCLYCGQVWQPSVYSDIECAYCGAV